MNTGRTSVLGTSEGISRQDDTSKVFQSLRRKMPSIAFRKRAKEGSEQRPLLGQIKLVPPVDGGEGVFTTPPESDPDHEASVDEEASSPRTEDGEHQQLVDAMQYPGDFDRKCFDDEIRNAITEISVEQLDSRLDSRCIQGQHEDNGPMWSTAQPMPTDPVIVNFEYQSEPGRSGEPYEVRFDLPQNWEESWTGRDLMEQIYPGEPYLDDLLPHVKESHAMRRQDAKRVLRDCGLDEEMTVFQWKPLKLSLKLAEQGVKPGSLLRGAIKPADVRAFRKYARELQKSGEPDFTEHTMRFDVKRRDVKHRDVHLRWYHMLFQRMLSEKSGLITVTVVPGHNSDATLDYLKTGLGLELRLPQNWTGKQLMEKLYPGEKKFDDLIPHLREQRAMPPKNAESAKGFRWNPLDLSQKLVDQGVRTSCRVMTHIKPMDVQAFREYAEEQESSGHQDFKYESTFWGSKDVFVDVGCYQWSFKRKLAKKL